MIGYTLGNHINGPVGPSITDIMKKRVIPTIQTAFKGKPDVGPVMRPSAQDNFYRDHPDLAEEHRLMDEAFMRQQEQ